MIRPFTFIDRRLRPVMQDTQATALLEFAFVLPIMILLFVGGYQLSDASSCKRKVTIAARAVADLVSQHDQLTVDEVDTMLAASAQIMAPYKIANAKVRVTQVKVDANRNVMIDWSRGYNITKRTEGDAFANLPDSLRKANTYYIYSEIRYDYLSPLGGYASTINFTQTLYMLPRKAAAVSLTT